MRLRVIGRIDSLAWFMMMMDEEYYDLEAESSAIYNVNSMTMGAAVSQTQAIV